MSEQARELLNSATRWRVSETLKSVLRVYWRDKCREEADKLIQSGVV